MQQHKYLPALQNQPQQCLWVNPQDGQTYLVTRSPEGHAIFSPVSAHNPQPTSEGSDPIALLGIGAVAALGIALASWWVGYASAPREVAPPSQVVVCQTEQEGHFFWSRTVTKCN